MHMFIQFLVSAYTAGPEAKIIKIKTSDIA